MGTAAGDDQDERCGGVPAGPGAEADRELAAHLLGLETDLLRPEVRRSPARLVELLAPDFREIGSSGRAWDRASIVAALADEASAAIRIEHFEAHRLAADLALVTYRSVRADPAGGPPAVALRSSTWRRSPAGRWQLVFHQGTPAA